MPISHRAERGTGHDQEGPDGRALPMAPAAAGFDTENGERITVMKGKKEIRVISYGEKPFYYDAKGRIIPHRFIVETFYLGHDFIAQTYVDSSLGKVKYLFSLKTNPEISSGWQKSPTGALDKVQEVLKNNRHKVGTNGQLVIGVTYDTVQARIKQLFSDQLELPKPADGEIPANSSTTNATKLPTTPHRKNNAASLSRRAGEDEDNEDDEDDDDCQSTPKNRKSKSRKGAVTPTNKRTISGQSPIAKRQAAYEDEAIKSSPTKDASSFITLPPISSQQRSMFGNEDALMMLSSQASYDMAIVDQYSQNSQDSFARFIDQAVIDLKSQQIGLSSQASNPAPSFGGLSGRFSMFANVANSSQSSNVPSQQQPALSLLFGKGH